MSETERDRAQSDKAQVDQTSVGAMDEGQNTGQPDIEAGDSADATATNPAQDAVDVAEGVAADAPGTETRASVASPQPVVVAGGAGTGSMIIGGVLAAAIGAVAVLVFLPEGWRPVDTTALEHRLATLEAATSSTSSGVTDMAALATALDPLEARVAELESAAPADLADRIAALEGADLAPLEARIATLEANELNAQSVNAAIATAIATAITPVTERVGRIEAEIPTQAQAAVAEALAAARAEVDAQAAAVTTREDDVEAAQARIAARAALAELVAATESGAPQPGALATLTHGGEVPAALAPFREGLVTLTELQRRFAPAARAALDAQAPARDAPLSDRLMTFLRSQTGARSLAPRDGTDPDAILSRAEAALRRGDLAASLSELDALTGAPAEAMAAWRAQAQTRLAAVAALNDQQVQYSGNEG